MYSQAGQDEFVLSLISKGVYLEIGASHPIYINNTYALEKNGWTGWSIDIDNQCEQVWKQERTQPLIIADAITMDYSFLPDRVDYLQLDIDPAHQTLKCLEVLLKTKTRFSIITFEHDCYTEGSEVMERQRELLTAAGYIPYKLGVEHNGDSFEDWWTDKLEIN